LPGCASIRRWSARVREDTAHDYFLARDSSSTGGLCGEAA
jgi:hypothetical protein